MTTSTVPPNRPAKAEHC